MRSKSLLLLLHVVVLFWVSCGGGPSVYDASVDPDAALKEALLESDSTRPILIEVGGDWCKWCVKFNSTVAGDPAIGQALREGFVVRHVFYDRKQNEAFVRRFVPGDGKLSLPYFILLEGESGTVIAQRTGVEMLNGEEYDPEKVLSFLAGLKAANVAHWDSVDEAIAEEISLGDSLTMMLVRSGAAGEDIASE